MRAAIRQILFAETPSSPIRLFGSGEQGAWYDPSDLSTLFQLSTDTTPNVTVGDPVGKILDKSGRGNHATQTTLPARPILRQDAAGRYYLEFDGIDDFLFTGNVNFTGTDKITVCAGIRKLSDTTPTVTFIVELSSAAESNNGAFVLTGRNNFSARRYTFGSKGSIFAGSGTDSTVYDAPITNVLTGIGNISGDYAGLRINGSLINSVTSDQGAGNYRNYQLYIGARLAGNFYANIRIYSIIIRGAQSTDEQISATEAWVNRKTGAY